MTATDYFVRSSPPCIRPSFTRASLEKPSDQSGSVSAPRGMRFQIETSLYIHLDPDPQHRLAHCSTVYELEDRTKPSISSF